MIVFAKYIDDEKGVCTMANNDGQFVVQHRSPDGTVHELFAGDHAGALAALDGFRASPPPAYQPTWSVAEHSPVED